MNNIFTILLLLTIFLKSSDHMKFLKFTLIFGIINRLSLPSFEIARKPIVKRPTMAKAEDFEQYIRVQASPTSLFPLIKQGRALE